MPLLAQRRAPARHRVGRIEFIALSAHYCSLVKTGLVTDRRRPISRSAVDHSLTTTAVERGQRNGPDARRVQLARTCRGACYALRFPSANWIFIALPLHATRHLAAARIFQCTPCSAPVQGARRVELRGFEPLTPRLQSGCSPAELQPRTQTESGGPAWIRTRGLSLIRTAL